MPKVVRILNVPDELHRELKVRAARVGLSLSDYLLGELRAIASRPTLEDLVERLRRREGAAALSEIPADAVRRDVRHLSNRPGRLGGGGAAVVVSGSRHLAALLEAEAGAAPHLLAVRVAWVLRRFASRGDVDRPTVSRGARRPWRLAADLPPAAARVSVRPATERHRHDGFYLAPAEALPAKLVTADRALASVPGSSAEIEVFSQIAGVRGTTGRR